MNFSDIITYSDQAEFSPNSANLAIVKGMRLTIYESSRLSPIQSWPMIDHVSTLKWSDDGNLLLCAQAKRGILQVFNMKDSKFECKISMGPSGLSSAWLSPTGRFVLTICKYKLRASIFSLSQKEVLYVASPKFNKKGIIFSKCGQFTGILQRVSSKDTLLIFNSNFQQVSSIQLKTENTEEVFWSNDNFYIYAYDSELFTVYSPSGALVYESSSLPKHFLSLQMSVNGCYFSLCSSANKISVIHSTTWARLAEICLIEEISQKDVMVYKEEEVFKDESVSACFEIVENCKFNKIEGERNISFVKWSGDERYVAVRFDALPNILFVWDIVGVALKSVIVHKKRITSVEWCPVKNICVIGTGNSRVYLWTEDGASLCDLPFEKDFKVNGLKWSFTGEYFLVKDKGEMVVAYPNLEEISG